MSSVIVFVVGTVADAAQVALATIALCALAGAIWQTSVTRRLAREALTHNYFPRFAEAEIRRSLALLLELPVEDDEQRRARFNALSPEEQLEMMLAPNLCEELGGVYKHGMVAKDVTKTSFGHTALLLWERSQWLIEPVREQDAGYFRDWQDMLIDMGYIEPAARRPERYSGPSKVTSTFSSRTRSSVSADDLSARLSASSSGAVKLRGHRRRAFTTLISAAISVT